MAAHAAAPQAPLGTRRVCFLSGMYAGEVMETIAAFREAGKRDALQDRPRHKGEGPWVSARLSTGLLTGLARGSAVCTLYALCRPPALQRGDGRFALHGRALSVPCSQLLAAHLRLV